MKDVFAWRPVECIVVFAAVELLDVDSIAGTAQRILALARHELVEVLRCSHVVSFGSADERCGSGRISDPEGHQVMNIDTDRMQDRRDERRRVDRRLR